MNLGALVDLGVPGDYLLKELKKLNVSNEYNIHIEKGTKQGITGTSVKVHDMNEVHSHTHEYENHEEGHKHCHGEEHCHEHSHIGNVQSNKESHEHNHEGIHNHRENHHGTRNYKDIKELIAASELNSNVKKISLKIFDEVAKAEAKVHNKTIEEVHFHEVGAIDSIVDIVGAAICIDYLNIDKIMSSPVEVGYGTVKCAHGILPVPAPATAEILKDIPVISKNVPFEATTPTGAAIVKAMAKEITYEKNFMVKRIGYGLGEKEGKKAPNVLRVFLGESDDNTSKEYMVECNIDDMRGEEFQLLMERLLEEGALDVFYTSIHMKKDRPATKISVLCSFDILENIKRTIFLNSSTIGVRCYEVSREKLERREEIVICKYGDVPVKISYLNGEEIRVKPEYDICKYIAKEKGVEINKVYNEIMYEYTKSKKN